MQVAKMIAWFWDNKDIVKKIKETTGKTITHQNIFKNYENSPNWKPIIDKLREDYNKAMYEVPIFHKRKRLDELQKHYDLHMKSGRLFRAQSVLRDAKDEVEQKFGDVNLTFTQITNNQYSEMTDEEIANEKAKILGQLEQAQKMKRLLLRDEPMKLEGE